MTATTTRKKPATEPAAPIFEPGTRPLDVAPPPAETLAAVPAVAEIAERLHAAIEARAALTDRANARLADAGPAQAAYAQAVTDAVRANEPTDTIKNEAPGILGEARELARLAAEEAQRIEMFGYDLRDAISENLDDLTASLDPAVERAAADYRAALDGDRAARQAFLDALAPRRWISYVAELGSVPPVEVCAEGVAERVDGIAGRLVPTDPHAALEELRIDSTALDQLRARERREAEFRAEDVRLRQRAADAGQHRAPERVPTSVHVSDRAVNQVRAIIDAQ